jgi:hypothetical protein
MAKFKFKGTTIKEAEEELERLCSLNVETIPLSHIVKVVTVLGVELIEGQNTGSQIRFYHKYAGTYSGYFGVHRKHKGGDEILIARTNFRRYMMPPLLTIIDRIKQERK